METLYTTLDMQFLCATSFAFGILIGMIILLIINNLNK